MKRRLAAMTLVELMLALAIVSLLSTAVLALLQAAARTNSVLSTSMTNQLEVEMALRRIMQQTRLCSTGSLTVPSGTAAGTRFSLVTQPDTSNNNLTYVVSYSLATVNGIQQLQESDSRYGPSAAPSVLIHNVQNFSVQLESTGTPQVLILNVTAGGNPPVSRTIRIYARNH